MKDFHLWTEVWYLDSPSNLPENRKTPSQKLLNRNQLLSYWDLKKHLFSKGLFYTVLNFGHCRVKNTNSYQALDRRSNPGLDQVGAQ